MSMCLLGFWKDGDRYMAKLDTKELKIKYTRRVSYLVSRIERVNNELVLIGGHKCIVLMNFITMESLSHLEFLSGINQI